MRASQLITELQSKQPQSLSPPPPLADKNTSANNKKNGKDKKNKGKSVPKSENNGNNEKENEEKEEKEFLLAMENLLKIRKNTFCDIKMHLDFTQNAQYPLVEFKS